MIGGGWRLGRLGGVAIFVHPSLVLVGLLIGLQAWSQLSDPFGFPDLASGAAAGLAVLTAVLFVASILAHELAHAGMSLLRGIPVRGITLYMLGGATHQGAEPERPFDEFLVTLVGPGVTAALGAMFLGLHVATGGLSSPWRATFGYLALVNLLMAGFNLLPGFPLDGGRILLAALWRATGDRAKALRAAARVGQVVAAVIIGGGLALAVDTGDFAFGLWAALIGWVLFQAATGTLSDGARRHLLRQTTAREVMSPPPPAVPADLPVGTVLDRYLRGHDGEAFPVVDEGHAVGFVSLRTIAAAQPHRPVREAMAGPEAVIEAGPEEPMETIAERLGNRQVHAVLVFENGRLVGVIEPDDVARMLRRHRGAVRARGSPG